jgi:hypothetical protein
LDCAFPAQKEKTLATRASEARSTENKARAEASFKKEERAKEGAKAMMEYQANGRVVREQMARLKALRLAKQAADEAAGVSPEPPVKAVKAPVKAAKASAKAAKAARGKR